MAFATPEMALNFVSVVVGCCSFCSSTVGQRSKKGQPYEISDVSFETN